MIHLQKVYALVCALIAEINVIIIKYSYLTVIF